MKLLVLLSFGLFWLLVIQSVRVRNFLETQFETRYERQRIERFLGYVLRRVNSGKRLPRRAWRFVRFFRKNQLILREGKRDYFVA